MTNQLTVRPLVCKKMGYLPWQNYRYSCSMVVGEHEVHWTRKCAISKEFVSEIQTKSTSYSSPIPQGGPGIARLGIVTAASADPEDSRAYYFDLFLSRGAEEVYWVPVHEGNMDANSDPEVVDNINRMTGFFFGGGSQRRITNSWVRVQ